MATPTATIPATAARIESALSRARSGGNIVSVVQRTRPGGGCLRPSAAGHWCEGVVVGRLVIDDATVTALLRAAMPDAEVRVWDLTGTKDHLEVLVRTKAFAGKSLLDRHRMVERALSTARADGRIHALQIRTELPED